MRSEEIKVDWLGPSFNKIYAGMHWSYRKKLAVAAHDAVAIAVHIAKLKPFTTPVHLTFTPHYIKRAFDISNYAFTVKLLEDGLVRAGLIPDDTNKWVRSITINCPQKKPEAAVIVKLVEAEIPTPLQSSLSLKQ